MMRGEGDSSFEKVTTYSTTSPDRPPVSKFRTVKRFEETGMAKDRERPGRL